MNALLVRTALLITHAVLNFVLVNYLLSFDITGSWLRTLFFFTLLFILTLIFIRHLFSFFNFIKKPKQ